MKNLIARVNLIHIFSAALIFRLILAPIAWHPDVTNHIDWGIRFFEYGADKFYAPESNVWSFTWPNQPPGTILIFALVRKVYELIFGFFWTLNISIPVFPSGLISLLDKHLYVVLLKAPAILADLGIAYLIYKFLDKYEYQKFAKFGAFLFLINPVIWYNSSFWGQTDSITNFFAMLSLWFLFNRKPALSALSLAVSLYIKVSLAIFIPIFLILFLKQQFTKKELILSVVLPIALFFLLTFPFSHSEPFSWLLTLYREKVLANQLQVITANAFNIWAALTGINEQPHSLFAGPLRYQTWGAILFLLSFIPLLYKLWVRPNFGNAVWVLALTSFSSFMLMTNMHERYLYPLFPYFTIIVARERKFLPLYLGVSGINLLNLYHLWWVPRISGIENMFVAFNKLLPRVLGFVNLVLYALLFSTFWQKRLKI